MGKKKKKSSKHLYVIIKFKFQLVASTVTILLFLCQMSQIEWIVSWFGTLITI